MTTDSNQASPSARPLHTPGADRLPRRVVTVPEDFTYSSGMLSVEAAQSVMMDQARALHRLEQVRLESAQGRVIGCDIHAPIDVPGYDNSQMDGYAVRTTDLASAGLTRLRVVQRISAGAPADPLPPGAAARIFTGAPIPLGADAVIPQEDCSRDGEWVELRAARVGENVRPRGNDIANNECILSKGIVIRAQEIGVLASLGMDRVPVIERPRVAIVCHGDELRMPGTTLQYGEIYNSNRFVLHALLDRIGCEIIDCGIVRDSRSEAIEALQRAASGAEMVLSTGGMSVGEEDHVKAALESVGRLDMWRVAVKPGKPLAYGRIGDADFVGLPGNPVSTLVTFCLFVKPFLQKRLGVQRLYKNHLEVRAGFDWPKAGRRREYARARIVYSSDQAPSAILHPRQGSDVLSSTAWADGLVVIPEGRSVSAGDMVRYMPFETMLE